MFPYFLPIIKINNFIECHSSCLECDGPGINDCTACPVDLNQSLVDGDCVCAQNYYDSSGTCLGRFLSIISS